MTAIYPGENPPIDFVTIIEAPYKMLAKAVDRRLPIDKMFKDYDNAYTVNLSAEPVGRLDDIYTLISNRLLTKWNTCTAYGAIADPGRVTKVRRLSRRDHKTGDEATLRSCAHPWAPIDMDDVPRPDGIAADNLPACAEIAIGYLPPAFHGVRCIVQATSGHGLKPGSRLRLWFWFSRPVTESQLKVWLRGCPIDRSTFRTAQPVYTCMPYFIDGQPDHLPVRLAWANGNGAHAVVVPPADQLKPPPRSAPPPPGSVGAAAPGDAQAMINDSLARMAAAKDGRRHETRWNEGRLLGGIAAQAGLDDETIIQWLIDAQQPQANVESEIETIREAVEAGRLEPVAIQPRSLLAGMAIEGDIGTPPPMLTRRATTPTTRIGRHKAQTRRLAEKMLCARMSDRELLSALHKQNNAREYPLLPQEVDQIAFAAAATQWSHSNV
jgi:hypothetical protein